MTGATLDEDDYIIGTDDKEIQRLGLQHALWREAALAAWRRAGIGPGMQILDLGCGPGYASFDLARLVGPQGRVVAVDQSEHFLEALNAGAAARGLTNIETVKVPIEDYAWPMSVFDAVWTRWVLCFLPQPEAALAGIDRALKPGGMLVTQEYVDYRSFRLEPAEPVFDTFLDAVQESWRHFGGDPNIARRFPRLFGALGWAVEEMQPEIHAARPRDAIWQWPVTWLEEAPDRLVELGFLSAEDAADFRAFIARRNADPDSFMMTPCVLTVRARKRRASGTAP